ncbi:MAG: UDP-N-acetylmuramate dehydrogenase [Lachnospiraceae bacterium]|nr:UDP-N-acetylmuramate dehydrogenase [Lachnospiraceae bacterium]
MALQLLENEMLSRHTTFKVGGPATYFVTVKTLEELKEALQFSKEKSLPYFLLGNGSNLLVSDAGYQGVIIKLGGAFDEVTVSGEHITAGAAALLTSVSQTAFANALKGLEFAYGIPGTIGGGLYMNAGAYGGEMKDVVESVTILSPSGEVEVLSCEEMKFGYRDSILKKEKEGIIVSCSLKLTAGDPTEIKTIMDTNMSSRKEKQPLEYPSAGSTFKRPEGYFAGKLISDAGLKGYSVGGAQVSEKHAGFVINKGGATAAEIDRLMQDVAEKVFALYGVQLEPEVLKVGSFS